MTVASVPSVISISRIAANTAIFGAVYGILLKPLPIRDLGRLVIAWETNRPQAQPVMELTHAQVRAFGAEARGLEGSPA